jgi:Bacterial regulatory proteins, luxR family
MKACPAMITCAVTSVRSPRIGFKWSPEDCPTPKSPTDSTSHLYLSDGTVKTHVGRVLGKLGLRDRVQAVVFAYDTRSSASWRLTDAGGKRASTTDRTVSRG